MEEEWKTIEGYPNYMISNLGRVKSLNYNKTGKEQILKLSKDFDEYLLVSLHKNRKQKTYKVHRLVAQTFIPNPYNLPQVNHKDENKQNNFVYINEDGTVDLEKSNIEFCTSKYNANYGTRNERASKTNTNGKHSKKVFQYDLDGNFIKEWPSVREIERQLGYTHSHISASCIGKYKTAYGYIWSHEPK